MQEKVSNFIKIFKKVVDNETKACYYDKKVKNNETKSFEINKIVERKIIMKKVRFNGKRFLKFVFIVSTIIFGAYVEDGNVTGALVLAMLI